jgi:uncharacterized lipoprotein YddW (UPF0748 family)
MRGSLIITLVFLIGCAALSPFTPEATDPPEYRMAWILTFQEDINSPASILKAVEDARAANLNAILPVAHRRGRAYYRSAIDPMFSPTDAPVEFDALQEFTACAHDTRLGKPYIEVHPWVVLFPVWLERKEPPPNHVWRLHPEWVTEPYDKSKVDDPPQVWLDAGVPGVEDYIVSVCKEIVQNYDVDGLNLDYVRYREGGYGYNPIAVQRFQKRYQRTDVPAPDDPQWGEWRREQITNLVRRIYVETKLLKPALKLSVCGIAWGSITNDFTKTPAYTQTCQDWPAWIEEGIIDIAIPMNYQRESDRAAAQRFRDWTDFGVRTCSSRATNRQEDRLFVVGTGSYLNTVEENIAQIAACRTHGADGACIFRLGANNSENKPGTALLQQLRERLYQHPAPVPATPWLTRSKLASIYGTALGPDGQPLDGAVVSLLPGDKTMRTSGTGFYAFVNCQPGKYQVVLKAEVNGSARTTEIPVILQAGKSVKYNVVVKAP